MTDICGKIASCALQSLLYEVSASPKPGLVDRYNQGAHKDMDFFTFMASTASLSGYFYKCAEKGFEYAGSCPSELFHVLRSIGSEAEKIMFEATGGVNTHKGLVFSLGILCAAASCCAKENESLDAAVVCNKVSIMTRGLCSGELASLSKTEGLTNGEKLYRKYGLKGIRGEVESGFSTVRSYSLPVLKQLKKMKSYHINDIFVQTLLNIIAMNEDTNIVARHGIEMLEFAKGYAKGVLLAGGMMTPEGTQLVYEMDKVFIEKNISPGGSADLLAVTIMLDLIMELNVKSDIVCFKF